MAKLFKIYSYYIRVTFYFLPPASQREYELAVSSAMRKSYPSHKWEQPYLRKLLEAAMQVANRECTLVISLATRLSFGDVIFKLVLPTENLLPIYYPIQL